MDTDKNLAFVLSGGGSRGALQVGALYALGESGLRPDLLVGTSIGALNAAFLALHGLSKQTMDALAALWREAPSFDPLPSDYVWRTVRAVVGRPPSDVSQRVREYFLAHGLTPELRFTDLRHARLIIVSSDLNTGKPVLHGESPEDSVLDALLASTALPPWFMPIERGDQYLMDGGVVSNLPVEAALKCGATEIVALDLTDPRDVFLGAATGFGGFVDKLILAVEKRQTDLELELAAARGVPLVYLNLVGEPRIPGYDFRHAKKLISQGYAAARHALDQPSLKGAPMTFPESRTYAGPQDLQAMLDLLAAVRPAERITDYPSIVNLHEAMALPDVQANTRLWFDAQDRLAAFAYVDRANNLLFEVDWQAADPDIGPEIVAWGVERIRHAAATYPPPGGGQEGGGEACTLDASCRDDDAARIALLEEHGFVRQALCSLRMVRSLDEPIPVPQIPAGFSIRHAAGEQEVEALVALHRAAFGTENMTVAERLAMMRVPDYDPELDLLAVAPDGRLAAYCFCAISAEENQRSGRSEGCTDPVATHPDFQGLGLAKALLLAGMHKLKERGMSAAVTGTSSENVAMQRTAQAVGFRVTSTTLWFAKPVDGG